MTIGIAELRPSRVVLPWAIGSWQDTGSVEPRSGSSPTVSAQPSSARSINAVLPNIAEADRVVVTATDTIAAAVVVDVLCTKTVELRATPTVLADTVRAAVDVVTAGLDENECLACGQGLVAYAAGGLGQEREEVALTLIRALSATDTDGGAAPASPTTVALALRRIEAMSRVVVRDAIALLEARETVTYHQA